ncbi:hypothetical protein OUZ56_015260 [Daphnia magna]|uniref:Uncharacterized protein n=1 Tax=Daphnia magna TaxID=35525 RepID=A0ABR0AMB2_9CRUS|nr:hypothetical protein OUZ56_015260 [Daphnia magna]
MNLHYVTSNVLEYARGIPKERQIFRYKRNKVIFFIYGLILFVCDFGQRKVAKVYQEEQQRLNVAKLRIQLLIVMTSTYEVFAGIKIQLHSSFSFYILPIAKDFGL